MIDAAQSFLEQIPFSEIHDSTEAELEILTKMFEQSRNN